MIRNWQVNEPQTHTEHTRRSNGKMWIYSMFYIKESKKKKETQNFIWGWILSEWIKGWKCLQEASRLKKVLFA